MQTITTIGLDIAKSVFQVHGRVPEIARTCRAALGTQLRRLKEQVLEFDRMIRTWHRSNEMSMQLDECPGVGLVLATALVASVADPRTFRSGRNFSAWTGLVPKQHSSGGKNKLGSISKQGDRYLRGLFVVGALAVIRYAKINGTKHPHNGRPLRSLCARTSLDSRSSGGQANVVRTVRFFRGSP
jgi:transposase